MTTKLPPVYPGIIDTHCHLNMVPLTDDSEGVVQRARAAGLIHMVSVGTTLDESREAIEVAARVPEVYATAGVHPHEVEALQPNDLETLRELAGRPKVVAVGEIGLDYHYDHSPREIQRDWFRRQMTLAQEVNLPVVIHSREAEEDTATILAEFPQVVGVLHCFSSAPWLAERGVELGYFVSFSGIITFKKADEVREAAARTPMDRLLVETDSPYLAPTPFRGKTNEPAYVTRVAEVLAEIKETTPEAIVQQTTENALRLFGMIESPG